MISVKNRTYIKDIVYKSPEDFLNDISYRGELFNIFNGNFIFRGHSSDSYKLQPYALRNKLFYKSHFSKDEMTKELFLLTESEFSQVYIEYWMLEDFFRLCDENQLYTPEVKWMREMMPWITKGASFFMDEGEWLPEELYELATLAQHHGIPTRLLDWTQDITIALYFAVSGVLQRLSNPKKLTYAQWIQEVSRTAIGAFNDFKSRKNAHENSKEVENIEIWALDTSMIFLHTKNNPMRIIHPQYFSNRNLGAQKGILTLWTIKKPLRSKGEQGLCPQFKIWEPQTLDEQIVEFLSENNVEARPFLYRITIAVSDILQLYNYLKHYKCDAAHLFPGYDGVVKCLQEDEIVSQLKN